MSNDAVWMQRALAVSRRALGATGGNPAVGAVLVRDGAMIAEGWTQALGYDHAEPHALKQADARGATLYVTLEPCCHHGRTPPCTDAILRSGVTRVVVGTVDPFPLVSGRGIAQLRAAGIAVDVGVLEPACRRLNLGFIRVVAGGLPEVTLKVGTSLDGRIASASGQSQWITSPEARAQAHVLRAEHDAILVGVGTVLADDPALTTRTPGEVRTPLRVVLDGRGRTPLDARVRGDRCVIIGAGPLADHGATASVPQGPDGLDLAAVLGLLCKRGVRRVLVEGGGAVHRSFLVAGLVDRIEQFIAGKVLAGGPGIAAGPGFLLAEAPQFRLDSASIVGPDAWLGWER